MTSPFPGMDPYLEAHWGDVHSALIHLTKVELQRQLGSDLVARAEERVYVDDEEELTRRIRVPNVRVVEQGISDVPVRGAAGLAIAEPTVIAIQPDEIIERYVAILDVRDGARVVTVIEFVSSANKLNGAGRRSYKQKQEECYGAVNFVEVDLTRTGERSLLVHEFELPPEKRGQYMVSCYRHHWGEHGRREGYGLKLQERLPGIRIPLRRGDADIVLDLQSIVDQAYEAGAYSRTINYNKPGAPPLVGDDEQWADALLRQTGRRTA
ncbi:MAG TPA: DUF4058 family protein [Tepidisphaeraceae bacterium]|nr:DUF4058 family protein [Tepidisphaeraceae bacterium]